eukprot:Seg6818.1 transcript_id=Seg6818.1/GoldUCD/mRNA.D3Y31 product="hypothetical protein" protein_id=Seg6818.1/GoldUCD/D3Y31
MRRKIQLKGHQNDEILRSIKHKGSMLNKIRKTKLDGHSSWSQLHHSREGSSDKEFMGYINSIFEEDSEKDDIEDSVGDTSNDLDIRMQNRGSKTGYLRERTSENRLHNGAFVEQENSEKPDEQRNNKFDEGDVAQDPFATASFDLTKDRVRAYGEPLMSYDIKRDRPSPKANSQFKALGTGITSKRQTLKPVQPIKQTSDFASALASAKANADSSSLTVANDSRVDDGNMKVVYKCRRNPPINPSIIVTTEPFAKLEGMQRARRLSESIDRTPTEKGWKDLDFSRDLIRKEFNGNNSDKSDSVVSVMRPGIDKGFRSHKQNETLVDDIGRQQLKGRNTPARRVSDLQVTDIFEVGNIANDEDHGHETSRIPVSHIDLNSVPDNTRNSINGTSAKSNQRIVRDPSLIRRQKHIYFTDSEELDHVTNEMAQDFDHVSDKAPRYFDHMSEKMPRDFVELDINEIKLDYVEDADSNPTNGGDAMRRLRKKRSDFARSNQYTSNNSRTKLTRSTESSLKSTDAEELSSDPSIIGSELRGVFRNLNEQHKFIEKRSNALINFKPDNRCDTKLVSSAYDMASAMEHRRHLMKENSRNNLLVANDSIGTHLAAQDTSKPSTNTSYFHADGGSLVSDNVTWSHSWSPSWLYVIFILIMWNSVIGFIHGIEDSATVSCTDSIKARLWCTIAVLVFLYLMIELFYEGKRGIRALSSAVFALALLLLSDKQPLSCYVPAKEQKMLGLLQASLNIFLAVCIFLYWLRKAKCKYKAARNDKEEHIEKELSELPIADLELGIQKSMRSIPVR